MKVFKRVTAALLTLALVFSLAGCGQDITWIAQKGDISIPIGVYIYYLESAAYTAKQEKVADKTVPVLDQEIDGQPAGDWIMEEAKRHVRQIIAADEWMAEIGAEVTKEDENAAKGVIDQYWDMYYKEYYEPMGIASSSFFMAADLQSLKETALFKAIYDKDGSKEIPKDDILDYYLENYYNISKISVPLTDSTTGEALSDDDISTLQMALAQYASDLDNGKSFADIKASYDATVAAASEAAASEEAAAGDTEADATTSVDSSSDTTTSEDTSSDGTSSDGTSSEDATAGVIMGIADLTFTESTDVKVDAENETDVDKTIKAMKTGEVQVINDGSELYICIKHDTEKTKDAFYDNDDSRLAVQLELKQEEFLADLEKRVDEIEGVEFNEAALRKYKPKSPEVDSSVEAASDESSDDGRSPDESTADEPRDADSGASSDTTTETSTSATSE